MAVLVDSNVCLHKAHCFEARGCYQGCFHLLQGKVSAACRPEPPFWSAQGGPAPFSAPAGEKSNLPGLSSFCEKNDLLGCHGLTQKSIFSLRTFLFSENRCGGAFRPRRVAAARPEPSWCSGRSAGQGWGPGLPVTAAPSGEKHRLHTQLTDTVCSTDGISHVGTFFWHPQSFYRNNFFSSSLPFI